MVKSSSLGTSTYLLGLYSHTAVVPPTKKYLILKTNRNQFYWLDNNKYSVICQLLGTGD